MNYKLWTVALAALLALPACKKKEDEAGQKAEKTQKADDAKKEEKTPLATARENAKGFEPLPDEFPSEKNPITTAKVDLGRKLYYDTHLSMHNKVSCNSCHGLKNYGVDNKQFSTGHDGSKGGRNAPTVYNAANQIAQFWDGRADSVEDQAGGPMLNPVEMGMPAGEEVAVKIAKIDGYPALFEKAFPEADKPVTFDHMKKAIGAFERKLVTPGRFDKFLKGDDEALTEQELRGFNKFVEVGCNSCHNGPRVGGEMYQKLGLIVEWPDKSDKGRYEVTKKDADMMKFKVPVLRNVAETEPYFHDGSVKTLPEAVKLMAKHQRGKDLSDDEIADIVAFLKALTGEIPTDYIQKPALPGESEQTAKKGEEPT